MERNINCWKFCKELGISQSELKDTLEELQTLGYLQILSYKDVDNVAFPDIMRINPDKKEEIESLLSNK
jgi:hypothetical protein